jgi:hypothetical protein
MRAPPVELAVLAELALTAAIHAREELEAGDVLEGYAALGVAEENIGRLLEYLRREEAGDD